MDDATRVDKLLAMLRVGNRATLDALFAEDLWDPLGCGCCSYEPSAYFDSWDARGTDRNRGDYRYRKDSDFVIYSAEANDEPA